MDVVITGASRGIGRALALELAARGGSRLLLTARDAAALDSVARAASERGCDVLSIVGDLGSVKRARELGEQLAEQVQPGATLIHNAGLWPHRRLLNEDGLEASFVVNHVAPLVMQQPLLDSSRLARAMIVSAGLIERGRFDPVRTPVGNDFSSIRTYCTTKLCFAIASRGVAAAHPELDMVVLHPGVVRTDLGARPGPLGWLVSLLKRTWESPESCAIRLADLLERPRWSARGTATWYFEAEQRPWPQPARDAQTIAAVRECTQRLIGTAAVS